MGCLGSQATKVPILQVVLHFRMQLWPVVHFFSLTFGEIHPKVSEKRWATKVWILKEVNLEKCNSEYLNTFIFTRRYITSEKNHMLWFITTGTFFEKKEVFNYSELHFSKGTFYKIHTLEQIFLTTRNQALRAWF